MPHAQLHCRYTLSLLFGLATERRRAVGGRLGPGRQAGRGRAELPVIVLIKLDWDGLEHHPKLP